MLDPQVLRRIDRFLGAADCRLTLVIGTTAAFHYITDWALRARGSNGLLVEINPETTPLTGMADLNYRERAAECLPRLLKRGGVNDSE
jgi:NAD-dependent SIR2 family protein deacetylase